jgi:hypothetical protein
MLAVDSFFGGEHQNPFMESVVCVLPLLEEPTDELKLHALKMLDAVRC